MDRKTSFILDLVKYSAYIAVLWLSINHNGLQLNDSLIPFILVFAIDTIRNNYLVSRLPVLSVPSYYLQLIMALVFIFLDGSPIGFIMLIILVAESLISAPHPNGSYLFFMSLGGFPLISAASLHWQDMLTWGSMVAIFINSLFLSFAFAVSYLARRQLDEKERAEEALKKLNRSRSDLEKAYLKLIEASKDREQLVAAEERTRLARELHDTLAHTLTAIIVSLEAGKKLVEKEPRKALNEINKSQDQARKGLDEVRQTVKTLRSRKSEKLAFTDAIKGLTRDYSGSDIDIRLDFENTATLSPSLEPTLYRIVQESITNSIRHGAAKLIQIRLKQAENELVLEIEDNGKGCSDLSEGYGLRGIRERVLEIGGQVYFQSKTQGGFLVKVVMEGACDE